jgi:hypothetical protein
MNGEWAHDGSGQFAGLLDDPALDLWATETGGRYGISAVDAWTVSATALSRHVASGATVTQIGRGFADEGVSVANRRRTRR